MKEIVNGLKVEIDRVVSGIVRDDTVSRKIGVTTLGALGDTITLERNTKGLTQKEAEDVEKYRLAAIEKV